VSAIELTLTLTLAAILVALAVYFGRRQFQTLRALRSPALGDPEDRRYLRKRAYRRLFCSALMLLFAALLVGWIFLDNEAHEIGLQLEQAKAQQPEAQRTQEQEQFMRLFSTYWIVALLVLLVLMALASMDFWATARYGLSQHRRLQAHQRAVIERDIAQHRRQRNGSS
jgi:heme A synthase